MTRKCALIIAGIVVTALTSACSVGPDYVRPTTVVPADFKESGPWKVAQPQDGVSRGTWWRIYDDPQLNELEEAVEVSNQNLIAAEARFRQARALVQGARSGYFPQVSAGASVIRSRKPAGPGEAGSSNITTNYLLSADVSWELDLWGKVRRNVEASQAGALASAADLESLRLSTQAELALNYFQLRTTDARKRLFETTVSSHRQFFDLTQNRFTAGLVSKADVLQAETQLKTTQAQAIDLGVQRAQLEHAMALLIGQPPAQFSIAPAHRDHQPPHIPLSQPSELLERRPDIAAAERRVAQANAQIGVAQAAYFPAITLSSTAGFVASAFSNWLTWPSRAGTLGAGLTQTLFDGGLRSAQVDEAYAVYDAALASYRQTVLTSFLEVEDNLAALRILKDEAGVQNDALNAARKSVAMTTHLYQAGSVSYLNVITAQTTALNTEQSSIDILGRRMAASVQLIMGMGGSWDSGYTRVRYRTEKVRNEG